MGRYQTFQHGLESGQAHESNRHPSRSSARSRLLLLIKLAQQPLFFWGSLWIAALMLIGLALGALLDPEFVTSQAVSSPIANPIQTAIPFESATTSTSDQPTASVSPPAATASLWSLGAIALSCAAGSMLLAQWFDRSSKTKGFKDKAVNPSNVIAANAIAASVTASTENPVTAIQPTQPSQLVSHPTVWVMPIVEYQMPPALNSPLSRKGAMTRLTSPDALVAKSIDMPAMTEAIVTIVPSDQSHPLDWDESSLVNTMDIRKRYPLSSWM